MYPHLPSPYPISAPSVTSLRALAVIAASYVTRLAAPLCVYGAYVYFCLLLCLIALCVVSVSDCAISLCASTVRRGVEAHLSLGVMDRCVGVQLEHRQVVLIGPAGETHSLPAGLVQRRVQKTSCAGCPDGAVLVSLAPF